jgi:MFS family permease
MVSFLLGSALSALSQNMGELIAFRALQGTGAGALEGLSFILVTDLFQGRRSAAFQGAMAGLMAVSFIAGPLIGGFLTDQVDWRACFASTCRSGSRRWSWSPRSSPRRSGAASHGPRRSTSPASRCSPLPWGCCSSASSTATSRRSRRGSPASPRSWRSSAAPVVPLRLLTDRRVGRIMLSGASATFGLYAGVLLLPRYFQTVRDVSATHSGLLIYPLLLGLLLAVNLGAQLIVRTGALRRVLLGGYALAALGALGFASFDASTPDWQSLLFMALLGLGIGPALSGLQIALTRTVTPRDMGAAMGTLLLVRQIGGAIALASAQTIYLSRVHDGAAVATGTGVLVVALAGAAIAAFALISIPRVEKLAPAPTSS